MLRELSLHVLDLVENSLNAGASLVRILVAEDTPSDRLTIQVVDNGRGMDSEMLSRATDPFFTTRTTRRVGLGLPFLKQAAEMCNGTFVMDSALGVGTTVTAIFQQSHIDRMPLGDVGGTLLTLIIGNPQVDFEYTHVVNGGIMRFDTRPIRAELGDVAFSEPEVIAYLKAQIDEL